MKPEITKKKEDVKPGSTVKEVAQDATGSKSSVASSLNPLKPEEKESVSVKKQEPVKVNVGSGATGT